MYSMRVTILKYSVSPLFFVLLLLFFFCFCFCFFVFFQLDNESSKQSRLQFYVNRNMFSYQRLSWRLNKNILSSLSRKPRNTHSQPCLQPLPRFLICKAPPFSHLKRCVVTLIGRKDKVAEVKHQNRFLS